MEPLPEPTPDHAPPSSSHMPTGITSQFALLIRQRWPEYVLEVVVILTSITLSLAVDEWKETSRKQQVEQQYLQGLASNLDTDIHQLQEVIAETRQVVAKAQALSNLTPPPADGKVAYDPILKAVRFVFKRPRFVAEEATFEELTSTGNMQLLSRSELKAALFDYYKDYESVRLVEAAELETTNALAAPYVLKRLPLAEGSPHSSLQVAEVLGELEFRNIMFVRSTTRQELLRDYENLLRKSSQLKALIKSQTK